MRRFLGFVLAICPAFGVVINSAVPGFTPGASAFTGVTRILYTSAGNVTSACSGSLISAEFILTAGHCVAGGSNWQVKFETPTSNVTVSAAQAYLHPSYASRPSPLDHLPQFDVAVLRLSSAAPSDAQIYGLKRDFLGIGFSNSTNPTVADIVGYGRSGLPGNIAATDGARHAATNTIDGLALTLNGVFAPDLPIFVSTTFGASSTGANEGLAHAGDSGGPLLIGNAVIGVMSVANLPRNSAVLSGVEYLNLYANLAENTTGDWVDSFLVPEPGTFALAPAGVLLLWCCRRRRLVR